MDFQSLVALALQEYASRPGAAQRRLQDGFYEVVGRAVERVGVDPSQWKYRFDGDRLLAVPPPQQPVKELAERFVRELKGGIFEHNQWAAAQVRLGIRAALHHGPAQTGRTGLSGSGVALVTALRDCEPLCSALRASGADLGVLFSPTVFHGVIRQGETALEPADLRQVRLPGPEEDTDGWLWIPGLSGLGGLDFADGLDGLGTQSSEEPPPAPAPSPGNGTASGNGFAPRIEVHGGRSSFLGANINAPGATFINGDQYLSEGGS